MCQFFGDFDVSNGQPIHLVPVYNPNSEQYSPHTQYQPQVQQSYDFGGYEDLRPAHIPITCGPYVCKSLGSGSFFLTHKQFYDTIPIKLTVFRLKKP